MTTSTEQVDEQPTDDFENIASRIRHILELYPIVSATMLQGALGPQVPARDWRPVLEEMISNKIVVQETVTRQSPAKRFIDYQRIMLTETSDAIKTIFERSLA